MHIYAVIPAAGKSSRMGRPKLTLPLGDRTVLEHVVAALHGAGIVDILLVVGPDGGALAGLGQKAGTRVLRLDSDTPDMQATVVQGLNHLQSHFRPDDNDYWLLLPADHPCLHPQVIAELIQGPRTHPQKSIFIPTHGGRRGHPALIAWRHVPEILAWPAGDGLNRYLRSKADETYELMVQVKEVLLDLDTPEDYQEISKGMAPK